MHTTVNTTISTGNEVNQVDSQSDTSTHKVKLNSWRQRFLARYELTGKMAQSAKDMHISWTRIQRECESNAQFRAACNAIKERKTETLEAHMDALFLGDKSKGNVLAGIFRLKALKPDVYRDKVAPQVQVNVLSSNNAPALLAKLVEALTPESKAALTRLSDGAQVGEIVDVTKPSE